MAVVSKKLQLQGRYIEIAILSADDWVSFSRYLDHLALVLFLLMVISDVSVLSYTIHSWLFPSIRELSGS